MVEDVFKWVSPKRQQRIFRFVAPTTASQQAADPLPDYLNLLTMAFSMCGLLMKIKWCAWAAIFCSMTSYANSRSTEDARQVLSSLMLSISAVVMTYLQNPTPMSLPK
ncbi:Oidioi.mRNA.OKI2018_I69.XSR.g16518.t1.cds [Oikopleura dioica]|uniref:PAT complex subunit Asterix n=1 Tax=Oikopleura dioica TaxID=34765 RepID=A0ABN7SGC7_OIKDI|nr:Oidioi.mRNA.OKI2018_I69.XSR.g16518.t1.cds [Oikopleura dioica]